ncbi:MAG: valine--tRNA ligase, partial [Deltaproteobacteria bacterium]|nr:valine--tRNA ligase [Deltaproteobacteria bacterium]
SGARPNNMAVAVARGIEIQIPAAELFDLVEEKRRIEKEIEKARLDVGRFESKLADKNFVERAPKEIVEKEKLRLTEYKEKLAKLETALLSLRGP